MIPASKSLEGRFQIDYILGKWRYSKSVRNAEVYPGADVDSDHNPVVATVAVKLKRILRVKNRVKWNLEMLNDKDSYSLLEFRTGVELALEKLIEHRSADNPEVKWTDFKETTTSVATETLGL